MTAKQNAWVHAASSPLGRPPVGGGAARTMSNMNGPWALRHGGLRADGLHSRSCGGARTAALTGILRREGTRAGPDSRRSAAWAAAAAVTIAPTRHNTGPAGRSPASTRCSRVGASIAGGCRAWGLIGGDEAGRAEFLVVAGQEINDEHGDLPAAGRGYSLG